MRNGVSLCLVALFVAHSAWLAGESSSSGTTQATGTTAAGAAAAKPKAPTSWVIGIARFSVGAGVAADGADRIGTLGAVLPELIVANLAVLPPHHVSDAVAAETALRTGETASFAAGIELASKLDDRALSFLAPAIGFDERATQLLTADKAIADAQKKLAAAEHDAQQGPTGQGAKTASLPSVLWDGHSRGDLIDASSGLPSSIAQSAKVNLLITGSLRERSGYAEVELVGYDSALGREVFSWTGYCSPDDPSPLARSFAHRIEAWAAGEPFARVDLSLTPDSAIVTADGAALDAGTRTVYRFTPGPLRLRIDAPGYLPVETVLGVNMGDRKSIDIRLDPAKTGTVTIRTTPPDAAVSFDSIPQGKAPLTADLNGSRTIVTASSPGYEPTTVVLPPSGSADIAIDLRPDDGLGPGGRVEKAKDQFYRSLGWLVLAIPLTALAAGIESDYAEAYNRSGDQRLYDDAIRSQVGVGVAAGATAALAINAFIHLFIYVRSTR